MRLCFGSKKLWRKQYDLKANGYGSPEAWLEEWRDVRSNEFFVLGSRDETSGMPAVRGVRQCRRRHVDPAVADGRMVWRELHGKYLVVPNVRFAYGHAQVLAALQSNADYVAHRREHGDKAARATALGQAISYRFKRDAKGWRVFATTELPELEITMDRRRGAIGVDLNADHVAVAETDASGNYVNAWRVPLVTYGKNTNQAEALIGDAVASVVQYAREAGKPIVIEKLDFRQKKAVLEGESRKYSRMLSSFAYGKVKAYFLSRGYREGVEIIEVNPAYSSVDRPGEVHGAVRADGAPGSGPGAGPSLARLFGAHPAPMGMSGRQWRTCRLHRTREEASEARADVLGRGIGTAETGACSAAPAGETQSGSGCREW